MSKRPNIQDKHEIKTERAIQAARRKRDQEMKKVTKSKAKAKKKPSEPEPYILSYSRGPVERDVPPKVKRWITSEANAQLGHYRRIYREQEELTPLRLQWVKEFLKRISGPRGFSVHAGTRRTISKNELPKKPRRPWRVIW